MKKMLLSLVAGLLLMSTSAMATTFNFSYSGAFNGFGQLTATANGDGSFTATSGTDFDAVYGTLALLPGASGNFGGWSFDNQLLPASNPLITYNGLLFSGAGGDPLLNIFALGTDAYAAGATVGGVFIDHDNQQNLRTFTLEAAPVPEPGTMMLLGAGFLGLAVFAKRRKNA